MLSKELYWPPRNFGAICPEWAEFETAKFVILPVPYDSTTTWRGGTREGAIAILDASMNMELFDRELGHEIAELGIHTTDDVEPVMTGPKDMAQRVKQVVGEVLNAGKVPVMLGGEHSLTFGGVAALAERSPQVTVFQLDAHTDLREEYCGTPYGHGCVMRRSSELPNVRIIQFGLRSTSLEEFENVPHNVTQFWAEDILPEFEARLREAVSLIEGDVYLTFDVDVSDPSWMPDTGTPEPGGLTYMQVRDTLRAVCQTGRVKAFDCLELIGGHPASAFATARLIYKAMGYMGRFGQ